MEEIIASGKADIVYMARALLADPFLPNKVMANRGDEIVRCLRCFTCMAERAATSTRRCTVNPLIGRELEGDTIYPAPEKKKVLVAGGGPGGLYAAYTAARRGHQVILCEKDAELGGILKSEQALPFKQEMYQLAGTYANLARKAGVEIRLNTAVTPELVAAEAPDALIIAVGSAPLVPPIPGLKGDNVVVVNNYYKEKTRSPTMWWSLAAGSRAASALSTSARRASVSTSSRCGMSWPRCQRAPPSAAAQGNREVRHGAHRLQGPGSAPRRHPLRDQGRGTGAGPRHQRHLRAGPALPHRRCRSPAWHRTVRAHHRRCRQGEHHYQRRLLGLPRGPGYRCWDGLMQ